MKIALIVCLVLVVASGIFTTCCVRAGYEYQNNVEAEWTLADRSSTIPAKRQHLDKFVDSLASQHFEGEHNALFFPTPENGFDQNFEALKTLQSRLHEIETMDVRSFEYQTAIQQITAQEQGEAHWMLKVFEGVWYLNHHFFLWDWLGLLIGFILWTGATVAGFVAGVTAMEL